MKQNNMLAMILAGGRGSRLHELTNKVAKPAVSYGGKYRIIDFPLSNCANSGINVVGVLTQYESILLNSYVAAGRRWGLDAKESGVFVLPPREKADANLDVYRGTADAISQNIDFIDTYSPEYLLVLSGDHIYKMNYDKILSMYQDRYKDASDFTFIFVGNVNVEEMKPLIAEYLGSLPAINRKETFKDNKVDMRQGVYKNEFVRKQETAKASNFVLLNGDCKYDLKNDILLSMTSQILDLVYTAKVREDEGGTYGVYVGGQLSKYPKEKALLQIVFETAPAKREKLMQIIFTELDNIAKAGPSEGDLNKVKEFMLKKHAEDLKENSYWLGSIDEYLFTGMNPIKDYEQIVNSITVKDIQKFTDDLFKQKNEIEVSMISPETPDKE